MAGGRNPSGDRGRGGPRESSVRLAGRGGRTGRKRDSYMSTPHSHLLPLSRVDPIGVASIRQGAFLGVKMNMNTRGWEEGVKAGKSRKRENTSPLFAYLPFYLRNFLLVVLAQLVSNFPANIN